MILILTQPSDVHADRVVDLLQARGADVLRFNPADFPAQAQISLHFEPENTPQQHLTVGDDTVDLAEVRAVWYRRPEAPVPHAGLSGDTLRTFVVEESKTFLGDIWDGLDCLWLPGRPPVSRHVHHKAVQLRAAAELGFEVPPTLFTNDPADFLDFYRRHNGQVVSKLAGFAFFPTVGRTFSRYTEVVSHRDIGYAQAVRYCPLIFQAYVPKLFELRITVVGQEVFAAEIHSQESHHTRHDWRRYDLFHTLHRAHILPDAVAQHCRDLVARLGLCYGAIDMVLTPDGRYVFLEINPNGQYLWIEEATGLPISEAICDLLMSHTAQPMPAAMVALAYAGV